MDISKALCREYPAQLWDDRLDGGERSARGEDELGKFIRHGVAMKICARCPITIECYFAAMSDPLAKGIWGGELIE